MTSYKSIIDGSADSDIIYYNANLSSTQNADLTGDPLVKFNESRDAPIVRNASKYYFSIIRFAMNGPNKNLPLFIPIMQTNSFQYTAQINPNLTIYSCAIPYQRKWYYTNIAGGITEELFTITPKSTPLLYVPETQNVQFAPTPIAPLTGFTKQDLSSRYYWVYTYKHMVTLVNQTFVEALKNTWFQFQLAWTSNPNIDTTASPFPYPTFDTFLADHDVPMMKYNEETKLFEIYGDTRAFNMAGVLPSAQPNIPLPPFTAPAPPVAPSVAVASTAPYLRLFFNSNMFGLFTNFDNTYYGASLGDSIQFPLSYPVPITLQSSFGFGPADYTNEILFANQNYTNILNNNPTLQGSQFVPPPSYNLYFYLPTSKQNLYWISRQDYNSTNSLWSPCQAIVFTSSLLPIKNEYTSKPVVLGQGNTGVNSSSSASAFEPIISDFVVDQQHEKAEGWRDFTLYEPTAEYKMACLQASHDEIRNFDIQVYWKYRLTGELIPLSMFNCSDVSIKMMFRRIDYRS